jgi:hypothetical protein
MTNRHTQPTLERGEVMQTDPRSLLGIAAIAALLLGLVAATASAAPRVRSFDAQFSDHSCGQGKLCGTGTVTGFAAVKSEVVLAPAASPAPGCFGGKGTRTVTLDKDPNSTMRLAIQGAACGARAWGTFKIVAGTGAFAAAKGSGVIWGTTISLRYYGVLTLTR